jgi:pimeloyl-ACP methyl ester carboxylesterase
VSRNAGRAGLVGAAAGVLAAGVGAGLAVERFLVGRRRTPDPALDEPFGSRRGKPHIIKTTDGLELYAEVDEPPGAASAGLINVVFCHGYALNLDCYHFQRRALAGQTRMIFYDQRSHGRSGRSPADKCTVDQLGEDLARVIEELAPDGPLVLIGHSMGGMSIMAYAAHHQQEFSERVIGVALLATSAGNLNNVTLGAPGLAGKLVGRVVPAFVGAMSRMPDLIESGRKAGSDIEFLLTKRYSFGSKVPPARVEFVAEMLAATPIEVVAEFFPAFGVHDKYEALEQLADVDVVIMCGENDLITPIEHSRQIAARLPSADFIGLSDCGHMLMIEYPEVINERLRELVDRAADAAAWEASR